MNENELKIMLSAHETWLNTHGEEGKRFVLNYQNLSCLNFNDANLEKCILTKCDLRKSDFSRARLKHAMLNGCDMTNTNFSHVKFDYASLCYSSFLYTNFYEASLRLADLTGTNLKGAYLFGCRLPENTWLIMGEEYSIQITHGLWLRVGCQNHKIEDWRTFRFEDIEAMDGLRAIKFYPRLLDILDYYTGRDRRPSWLDEPASAFAPSLKLAAP